VGYAAYDHNGQIDLLGSATSFYHFGVWARTRGGELAFFGEEGYSEQMGKLLIELKAEKAKDPVVEAVRKRLIKLLPKASGIFIISES